MESTITFSQAQWDLVLACFVMAAFALIAGFVYLLSTKNDVSAKYRPAGVAGATVTIVAFLAYLLLIVSWITGFHFHAATATFTPSGSTLQFRNAYRYVDWAITVPILTIELSIICTLVGAKVRSMRQIWVPLAWIMIATGFLGDDVFNGTTGRLVWGLISTAAFIPLYFLVLKVGFSSARELHPSAGQHVRRATLLLALTWGVYPLAYLVPFFFEHSAGWAVGRQVAFTFADIAAKVGFGFFIHFAAKARTARDVAAGEAPHPDGVYIDGEMAAEAQPVAVGSRTSLMPGAARATGSGAGSTTSPPGGDGVSTERRDPRSGV